ncbi:MAG: bifunctional UDP-sugar hydrolase/5'-nucleotidase [bacterium]
MMRKITVYLLFLLLSAASWAGETWQFTILHTNDLHGWMMPFDYQTTNTRFMQSEFVDNRYTLANAGGLARRATLIADLRKEAKNPLALIDAGDVFTRGPWHRQFYGVPEIAAYNQMGYDMLCVGNNEFKAKSNAESQQIMLGLMRQSEFPWLAANLTVGTTEVPVEGIHPYIVRRYGTMRVGFLGLTAPRVKDYPQAKGWTISDPIETAKKWVPLARKECDILIAVTHIGTDMDKQLAAKVEGIDVIVGGDSHTFIPQPIMIANPKGVQVPIVQDGAYGVCVGRLELTFDNTDGWHLTKSTGELLPVDDKVKEDPTVKQLLEQWIKPVVPEKVTLVPQLALAA